MVGSEHGDIVTGLQGRTHFGPPDWQALLAAAKQEHAPERVDVYFCGPPGLAAKVRPICQRLGMTFYEERF
jgi:respiratory burst oxidase